MSKFIKKSSDPPSPSMQKYSTWQGYKPNPVHTRNNSAQRKDNNIAEPRDSWKKDQIYFERDSSAIMTRKRPHRNIKLEEHFENVRLEPRTTAYRDDHRQDNSRINYSPIHSSIGENEIEERFKQIEQLFSQQNENLKQQKEYLLHVIEKMKRKQKQYKNQIKNYKEANDQLYFENNILKKKYQQAREFISSGIGKIEEAVNNSVNNGVNSTQNIDSKNSLTIPHPPKNGSPNPHVDTTTSMNITDAFEELSDKFDVLMFEYQKTRSPELRKQCMQIAKQIKRLKKNNGLSVISQSNQ